MLLNFLEPAVPTEADVGKSNLLQSIAHAILYELEKSAYSNLNQNLARKNQ